MSMLGKFVHLHVHSTHTMRDSVIAVSRLCERVRGLGMTAVALTDTMSLSGVVELAQESVRCGVAPVFGAELLIGPDRDPVVVLCESVEGFQNLCLLLDDVAARQDEYATWNEVEHYSGGLIGIAGGLGGDVWNAWRTAGEAGALRRIRALRDVFTPDRFFLDLCDTGPGQKSERYWNEELLRLARLTRTRPVATGNCRVADTKQLEGLGKAGDGLGPHLADARLCFLRTGKGKYLLGEPAEYIGRLGRLSLDAIRNTVAIAERCRGALGEDPARWLNAYAPRQRGESAIVTQHRVEMVVEERGRGTDP